MPMTPLFTIRSRLSDYEVYEGSFETPQELINPATDIVLVDRFLYRKLPDVVSHLVPSDRLIVIVAIERNKTVAYAMKVVEKIMEIGISKRTRIVSFGGGIVQDLTGFISSILYRGLEWHFYPTTLLAQTDSCIGAKTSINFLKYKNLIGTFYNPTRVMIVPEFVATLPRQAFLSGMGEIIKLHLIGGRASVAALQRDRALLLRRDMGAVRAAVLRSLEIKKGYIEVDEFDKGVRNLLNYGHCVGHAIESSTQYQVPHGQAVTLGMILANRIAVSRGSLEEASARKLELELLMPFLQKEFIGLKLDSADVISAMKRDKKRVLADLVVVYLQSDGTVVKRDDVKEDEVKTQIEGWNSEHD